MVDETSFGKTISSDPKGMCSIILFSGLLDSAHFDSAQLVLARRRAFSFVYALFYVSAEASVPGSAFSGERSFSVGSSMLGEQSRFWGRNVDVIQRHEQTSYDDFITVFDSGLHRLSLVDQLCENLEPYPV